MPPFFASASQLSSGSSIPPLTRVLLIDDDEDEWLITRDLLRDVEHGARFKLDWVPAYDAGVEAIAQGEHDIYLIDYRLGTRSGLDLLRFASQMGTRAPMILLTGQGDPDVDAAAAQAGAADYLIKDELDAALLERAIRYAIAQKRTQEALRVAAAQNARLSAAIDNAGVGVLMTDVRAADHVITFVNPAFETISGYSAAECIGKNPRFLQGPETDPELVTTMSHQLAAGHSFEGILLNYRKDGTPFWNGMLISPVRNDEGQIESWIGFASDVTAKIEAEKALRESRENLAAAQRLTHLGSWTVEMDPLGAAEDIRISWSDEVYRIMGVEPQSFIPTPESFFSLINPEDRATAIEFMRAASLGEVPFDLEYRIIRADGQERTLHISGEVERDAEGRASRIIGTTHDITESRQDQAAARESRERLQSVVQNAPLMIWALDANGLVTFIEGQAMKALGATAEDYVGKSIFDVVGPDATSSVLARRALGGEAAGDIIESRGLFFDTKYSPLHNEKGEVTGAVGVATDITSRIEAEQAFRQSESRLSAVLEVVPMLIWAIDARGIFTLSQGRALESLGLKQGEAVGRSLFEMYGSDTAVAEMARRALAGDEAQVTLEVGPHIFDVSYTPTRDQNNRITGVVGVSYDITERIKAQRKLEESEARFERIVANVPGMVYRFHRALSGKMSFLYVSDGVRDIYGVGAEEVKRDAQVLIEVIDPDDLTSFYESVFQSERDMTPWYWEGRVLRTDGDMRWIRGQARPARQEDGSTVWDGLVVDISESRAAQMELLANRSALDEAQKLARIGSFQWDLLSGEVIWSDQMFRLFGYEPGAFKPTFESIFEFTLPEERTSVQRQSDEAIAAGLPTSIMVRVQRRDGAVRILQTHSRVETDGNHRVIRLVGSAQDVTESVESQRALQESEQRYAFAAQGANDGLWDWNLRSDCIYLSPRWKMMLGHSLSEIGEDPEEWFSRVHPEDIERLRTTLNLHLSGESPHFECEYRLRAADGSYRWMLGRGLAVYEGGQAQRIAGSQTDITERKTAEAQLSRNAFYDTLTGLPNRALFLDRLDSTLARAQRNPEYTYAVLFLDIDRFKKINDSLGHLPGDQLLIEAAARFESCLRPGDTVARLGGDEFAVLIDDIRDTDDVNLVAGRIQKALETPFSLEGKEVFVTVSIGVAPSRGAQDRPDELLRNADTAMYRAKSLGRARHEVFDATMHQRAVRLLELETDLWRAVERDELRLHYQPIINLEDGKVCGFEALIRWEHPERGLVSPGEFIPLAEETGLIVPIGWWVLGEACRQAKAWAGLFPGKTSPTMSVNLSTKQFSQSDLIGKVKEIVGESGFDPSYLKLEITESVIMENTESASAMLLQLKALGIRLSMDDFGTGYSSLSYLHRFPLDTLKIDRSFVSQMQANARNGEIVGTILSLASGLGMTVVAEGVETEEQLYGLRKMGCGFAQGFFFSKPLTAERIEELMAQNPLW